MISSETLFHFTNSKDNLLSILEHHFKPKYHKEIVPYIRTTSDEIKMECAYPMVCFCDLPLSQILNHIGYYGHYGIGLTKEWGIANGLNPIIYFNQMSFIAEALDSMVSSIRPDSDNERLKISYLTIVMHSKLYKGTMRRDETIEEMKFYDEKEWRYIPRNWNNYDPAILFERHFNDETILNQANAKISSELLKFEPKDIKYIIVKDDSEILDMYDAIWRIKGVYNDSIKKILCSRIISTNRIKEDF